VTVPEPPSHLSSPGRAAGVASARGQGVYPSQLLLLAQSELSSLAGSLQGFDPERLAMEADMDWLRPQ
jgi:hypothetical protein